MMDKKEIGRTRTTLKTIFAISAIIIITVGAIGAVYLYIEGQQTINAKLGSTLEFHVTVYIQRVGDEQPILWSHHPGVLTTIGKNWIEDQLGDSPSADPAKWISLSTSSSSPSASWTQIPSEITTGGLARAAGTYSSTGDGQWTISYQFTASATHTDVQLTGLQWASSGDGNLLCADTFTPVTLNSGDKITITWTVTVS